MLAETNDEEWGFPRKERFEIRALALLVRDAGDHGPLGWIRSMSSDAPGPQGRRQQNVRLSPAQVVRATNKRTAPADCRVVDGHLYVTVHLPEIKDEELRYAIRGRYLLVWGDGSAHDEQRLVMLPTRVDPDQHSVRFQNGVFDARIKVKEAL
jgi:HSP20 family molecular chaperone IbpA